MTTIPRAVPRASVNLFLTLSAALLLAAGPGRAAPGPDEQRGGASEPERERAALGAMSYRIHCLSCHGKRGAGDGPMAELLKISPADLTRLAENNGGHFPAERVHRAIDGRDEVAGHGNREMPVWGIGFRDPGRAAEQEAAVRARILDLVAYLETLQAGGERPGGAGDG